MNHFFNFRFKECCELGFRGALKLAAFCTGKSEDAIENAYRKWCNSGTCFQEDEPLPEEEVAETCMDAGGAEEDAANNECHEVLSTVQRESVFVDPEGQAPEIPQEVLEDAFRKVSNKENLESLFTTEPSDVKESLATRKVEEGPSTMPTTLLEAMSTSGDIFNSLFRLSVKLRSKQGGVDTRWLGDGKKVRQLSRKLNWHQFLGS